MSNLLIFAKFCGSFWNISSKIKLKHSCCRSQFYRFAVMFGLHPYKQNKLVTMKHKLIGLFLIQLMLFCHFESSPLSSLSSASETSSSCAFELSQVLQRQASVHTSAFSTQIQFSLQARLQLQDTSSRTYKVDKKQEWI